MSRPLKKINRYFTSQTRARYNTLLQDNVRCNTLVDIDRGWDVDYIADLADFGIEVPQVRDGDAAPIDLSRMRRMKFAGKAKAQLSTAIPMSAGLKAAVSNASAVSMSFSEVQMKYVSHPLLEAAIRGGGNNRLEHYLADNDRHIVTALYSGTVNVFFEATGGGDFEADVELQAKIPVDAEGNLEWTWTTKYSVATTQRVTFGFETVGWRRRARRLRQTS